MKKNISMFMLFTFVICLAVIIWVKITKEPDDIDSKITKEENVSIQKVGKKKTKPFFNKDEKKNHKDKKNLIGNLGDQPNDAAKLTEENSYNVIDQLNKLLEQGYSIPNKNYFPRAESLFMKIRAGLEKGTLDKKELEMQVYKWFKAGDERSLTAAIVVASALGNNEMVRVISEFYKGTNDLDMKFFIERQVSNMRFDRNENVSDLLETIDLEQNKPFKDAMTSGVAKYANPEVIDWMINHYKNAGNDENRAYWIKRIEQISNPSAFNYLITSVENMNNSEIRQAGLRAIGASAENEGIKLLFSLAAENNSPFNLDQIGEAMSSCSNESNWNLIKEKLIFGTDEKMRIVAAKAIAKGFSYQDKSFVKATFKKLLNHDPPEALRIELIKLINELEGKQLRLSANQRF